MTRPKFTPYELIIANKKKLVLEMTENELEMQREEKRKKASETLKRMCLLSIMNLGRRQENIKRGVGVMEQCARKCCKES